MWRGPSGMFGRLRTAGSRCSLATTGVVGVRPYKGTG